MKHSSIIRCRLTLLAAVVVAISCSDTAEPRTPSSMMAITPLTVEAAAGAEVAPVPTIEVRDQHGSPLPGVAVSFSVEGGGSVSQTSVRTGADGRATPGRWVMDTVAGHNALIASVAGVPPLQFVATGLPGTAASLLKVAGADNQSAVVGTAVSLAPTIRVVDRYGNSVANHPVVFSVVAGGGTLDGPAVSSNPAGLAAPGSWVLGTTAGRQEARAAATGLTPALFTATALPDVPATLAKHAGDFQAAYPGRAVAVRPAVIVRDRFGNGIPGIQVVFSPEIGSGEVTGGSVITGADGIAAVGSWVLGRAFQNRVTAAAPGLPDVTFIAEGMIPGLTVEISPPLITVGGTAVATARITDGSGAPITGRQVVWGSTQPGRATVAQDGTVTAVSSGSMCITATVDGASRCANFSVAGVAPHPPSATLTVDVTSTTLRVGDVVQAVAIYRNADDEISEAPGTVMWGSHNPLAVIVTPEGRIYAIAEGNATVSATVAGVNVMTYFTVVR
jgi:adhesin/invasin